MSILKVGSVFFISALMLLCTQVPKAAAGIQEFPEDFEHPSSQWFFTGGAGFDSNRGLAHRGNGNAWVRNTGGWNAINIWVDVPSNSECSVLAWLRSSASLTDGYMSVRNDKERRADHNFNVINEVKLVGAGPSNPANANYNPYTFRFNSGNNTRVLFYVGLWGNGRDSWIQVDDLGSRCRETTV
jgi:hypothetical protein